MNTIDFDLVGYDYLVNGKPLLDHLRKHEKVTSDYTPSVASQPGAAKRLMAEAEPDLVQGHVALYLCGMCGGYDGSPIGVKLTVTDETVEWSEMGYCSDHDEAFCSPFRKVSGFKFKRSDYDAFIRKIGVCEPM